MYHNILFIVNPIAGSAPAGIVARVARDLADRGCHASIATTRHRGHAEELSRSAAPDIDLIVAVGGDGTLREVIAGRQHAPRPIALLPVGTENIVAKHYGFTPTADGLWRCISAGVEHRVDLAQLNGHTFFTVAGAGFDAAVVERLHRTRRGHITREDYIVPIWRTFWEYRFPPIRVEADGEQIFDGQGFVLIGNLARYSLGIPILRDADECDGLLDVCIYRCRWQLPLLVHAAFTWFGRHVGRRSVVYRQARRIHIESPAPVPVQVDGDLAGALPIDVSILPGAAILCLPRQPASE